MAETVEQSSNRFLSLDVFRGMTICFMIIVNNPGGDVSFGPLDHAHWFGFTTTDLVFPSFLVCDGQRHEFFDEKVYRSKRFIGHFKDHQKIGINLFGSLLFGDARIHQSRG